MKRIETYMVFACALAALASCDKNSLTSQDNGGRIRFAVGMPQTKGLLNSTDLVAGSKAKVYDILSDGEYTAHINGDIASYVNAVDPWSLQNEPAEGYAWRPELKTCDHNFFAWLTRDKSGLTAAGILGAEPAITNVGAGVYRVNVNDITMNLTTTQFDFSYSDVVKRNISGADYSVVNIPLHHFFAAFGMKAHNYDKDAIRIESVKLYGITNKKHGDITFDVENGTSVATYTPASSNPKSWTSAETGLELLASPITIPADGEVANIITASGLSTAAAQAFLMWPQTASELMNDAKLSVTYSAGGATRVTYVVSLCPVGIEQGWDAGTRHQIELAFTSKYLRLDVEPLPWDYEETSMDYDVVQDNDAGKLSFKETECVISGKNVYFKNGLPITCYFTLNSPINGTWMISKGGDFDAFEIDNVAEGVYGDGVDYAYGTIDGNQASFTIYPKISDPKKDYQINLSFAIRTASGRVISADDVIQGKDASQYYTIILQTSN